MGNAKSEMTALDSHTQSNNGAVDKIRDLLFGSQMDSYDQHFQHLETMIVKESRAAIDQMSTRLITIEAAFNQRIEKTEQTLEQERKERITALDVVNDALQQNFQQLNDQLQKLEAGTAQNITDVKILLEQQTQSLSSQIQTIREQFNQSLNDQATRLDAQIIKRQKISTLLSEISTQINDD
jgi:phenylalanyl-tRNA synthetase alpha subunit